MDIAPFIADLLQQHDEVSVSGLGTFYKKRVEGSFNKQLGEFLPAAHTLSFRNEPGGDEKLAEFISKHKGISLTSSAYFVEKFAEGIHSELKNSGKVTLNSLGTLFLHNEEITFEAEPDRNWGVAFYGLNPVKDVKKQRKFTVENIDADEDDNEENFVEHTSRKGSTAVIIVGIITLLLAGFTALHYWNPALLNQILRGTSNEVPEKIVIPVGKPGLQADSSEAVADSIMSTLEAQGFEADSTKDTIDVITKATPVSTGTTYEIIAASLNRQSDAEKIVKAFKTKGIDARIVIAKNKKRNNILVSLASFNDKNSAQKELLRIQKDIEPGAYIYDLKN